MSAADWAQWRTPLPSVQPSPAHQCQRLYNQLHRHLEPDRTPAGMETRDNIDKIKCTFIACQSRKITRSMKIFKAKQTSVFFQWPHPWTDQMQCQCQWQSTNVKQQCHEMILNVNDMQTAAIRIISKMFQFVHLTRPVRRCWCSAGSVGGHHIHAVWSFPS